MSCRYILLAGLLVAALGLSSCERDGQPPAPPVTQSLPTKPILTEAITPEIVELPNEALPIWRRYAPAKPALALLSQEPYLQQIPKAQQEAARQLLASATDSQLARRTSHLTPDAVFLPSMALSAALDAGYFSQVIWVFPSAKGIDNLSADVFREQLVSAGIASEDEADDLTLEGGVLQGTLRGVPFQMVHHQAIPKIAAPLLLHIDPSFFQPLYKGEIKTPLYAIITKTLASLRAQEWQVAAATIVRPNPEINLPLATRFLADDIASILRQPSILLQTMPESWELRGKALYLENFMQKEEIRHLYEEMERKAPRDPAVKYALYQTARQDNQPDKALAYLKQAVAVDPTYAYEYVALSALAQERQLPEKSVQMLQLAQAALPNDPNIVLRLARALINIGHSDMAKPLVKQLKALPWSPVYHSEVIAHINTMAEAVGE